MGRICFGENSISMSKKIFISKSFPYSVLIEYSISSFCLESDWPHVNDNFTLNYEMSKCFISVSFVGASSFKQRRFKYIS